jgi:hypothetical protein
MRRKDDVSVWPENKTGECVADYQEQPCWIVEQESPRWSRDIYGFAFAKRSGCALAAIPMCS